ncbi:MAG: hypothetical protein M1343_05500 [Chloroflexi bacterium]|nr:hypothetical protein [Chloroflexota bacterium]
MGVGLGRIHFELEPDLVATGNGVGIPIEVGIPVGVGACGPDGVLPVVDVGYGLVGAVGPVGVAALEPLGEGGRGACLLDPLAVAVVDEAGGVAVVGDLPGTVLFVPGDGAACARGRFRLVS